MLNNWHYHSPPQIRFGENSLSKLDEFLQEFDVKNIGIIIDKTLEDLGLMEKISDYLFNYNFDIFTDILPFPSISTFENALQFTKKGKFDLVLGIGGGSSIDVAKVASVLANKPGKVKDYIFDDSYKNNPLKKIKREINKPGLPFVAIPTTAGTGSEVVMWSVIWDLINKTKQSISHPYMFSKLVIIDPTLTLTLPKKVLASAGIDSFCHAMEAYWSNNSNHLTISHSLEAIKLIFENLEKSYNSKNIKYRINMGAASLLAGLALSSGKTNSSHSMGYSLTQYFNVPHGAASAMFLPALFEFNFDSMGEKKKILSKIFRITNGKDGKIKIRNLMKNIGLPTSLKDVGVKKSNFNFIIDKGYIPFRMKDNPAKLNKSNLKQILIQTY